MKKFNLNTILKQYWNYKLESGTSFNIKEVICTRFPEDKEVMLNYIGNKKDNEIDIVKLINSTMKTKEDKSTARILFSWSFWDVFGDIKTV